MPLNLTIYISLLGSDNDIDVPWEEIIRSLAVVLCAIVIGVATTSKFPRVQPWMSRIGNVSGVCMIVTSFVASSLKGKKPPEGGRAATPLWGHDWYFYLVVGSPFLVSLLISLLVSSLKCLHLKRPERVAIVVEVSYQNVGIASAVAVAAFCGQPRLLADAAAVPVIYGLFEAVFLAIFCLVMWKFGWTYSPPEAPICKVIVDNYQPRPGVEPASSKDADVVPNPSPSPSTQAPLSDVMGDLTLRSWHTPAERPPPESPHNIDYTIGKPTSP